jgi:hypothetical protein
MTRDMLLYGQTSDQADDFDARAPLSVQAVKKNDN